jgi:hypothetical protein
MSILVTIRDGRAGRDPQFVTDDGGEVLAMRSMDAPPNVGDRLELDDGTHVEVIGMTETIDDRGWSIVAHIGEVDA